MKQKLRALRPVMISTVAILSSVLCFASATLQIIRGSGEFQSLQTSITVSKPESLVLQWTTNQVGAAGGTWRVTIVNGLKPLVIASGEAQAPTQGHVAWFTIPSNAFLHSSPPRN